MDLNKIEKLGFKLRENEDIEFYSNDNFIAAVRVGFKYEDTALDELIAQPECLRSSSRYDEAKKNVELIELFRREGLSLNYELKLENIKDGWEIIFLDDPYVYFILMKK
jgi:hypothetical protein